MLSLFQNPILKPEMEEEKISMETLAKQQKITSKCSSQLQYGFLALSSLQFLGFCYLAISLSKPALRKHIFLKIDMFSSFLKGQWN